MRRNTTATELRERFYDMRYILILLALAGIVVSSLALQVHYSSETSPCSINEHWDCGIVNHSSFAEIAHIPVAGIGVAGYLIIAILAAWRKPMALAGAAVAGLIFSLYFTHIERDILQVWCLYCVISQSTITLITLLGVIWAIANRPSNRRPVSAF
jgi:vitamin-K-epoxide reductase (warfarin-sensitive)